MSNAKQIPAFVNPKSGTAEGARDALSATGLFDIREVDPSTLTDEVRKEIKNGAKRILVSGGDGSIRSGAAAIAGTDAELAVLPAGTLNHFAKDQGIPTDLDEAARVAGDGEVGTADVSYVGDEIFLNTSSIGAYVTFMRVREKIEKYVGYRLASLIAGIRTLIYMRTLTVTLDVEGQEKTYTSPLVFIGVGERELKMPTLGNRKEGGKRGLHVIVVSGRRRSRLVYLAWEAVSRGVKSAAKTPDLDSFLVDKCTVSLRRSLVRVALDGELLQLSNPLEYRLERDKLHVVRGPKAAP